MDCGSENNEIYPLQKGYAKEIISPMGCSSPAWTVECGCTLCFLLVDEVAAVALVVWSVKLGGVMVVK